MVQIIYGRLKNEPFSTVPTALDIIETPAEAISVKKEYRDVFGTNNIEFFRRRATSSEIRNAKAKAFANLLTALKGPVTNVISGLQNK